MVKVFTDRFTPPCQGIVSPGYYLNAALKTNLDRAKAAVKDDWDMVLIIDGAEGVGKSTIGQQIGYYCDPSLTVDRIVFRADEFRNQVLKAEKYQAVVFDEAYAGLSSRQAMSDVNKGLVSMLTEIRQKNLFIIIILPSFFDLDKYAAIWRSRALIHVTATDFKRGFFTFYNYSKKKNLYVYGRKHYNYKWTRPDFQGRFVNFFPCGKEEYKKKKRESLSHYAEQDEKKAPQVHREVRKNYLWPIIKNAIQVKDQYKLSMKDLGNIFGFRADYLGQVNKKIKDGEV